MIDLDALRAELVRDEGLRPKPYVDTVGKVTIGIGRNLTDRGLSQDEIDHLFANDVKAAIAECEKTLWWEAVKDDPVRSRVMVNMMFNLGPQRLSGFVNTLKAVRERRWKDAAAGMAASLWAHQVGDRATRLIKMMDEGV